MKITPQTVLSILLATILLGGCSESEDSGSNDSGFFGLSDAAGQTTDSVQILSRQVFKDSTAQNIASHSVLVPKGWTAEGQVVWAPPRLYRIHPSRRITVKAPDDRMVEVSPLFSATEIEFSPEMRRLGAPRPHEGMADSGAPIVRMPKTLEEWRAWVRKHGVVKKYPEATNIKCESLVVLPGYTKYLQQVMQRIRKQQRWENLALGSQAFSSATAYSARYSYEVDGKKWEQAWIWIVGVVGQTQKVGRQIWWTIEPCMTFRAPAGKLDEAMPLLMTIANSVRATPEWARMKANHVARMQRIDTQAFIEQTCRQTQFSREMRNIVHQTWKNQNEAGDRGHRNFLKAINETGDYAVPNSNEPPVQLPMHYKHIWQSENGDIVLSNNANYEPGIGNTKTWKKMEQLP